MKNIHNQPKNSQITIKFLAENFYKFYIQDHKSDMQQIYYLFRDYFGTQDWVLSGTRQNIEETIENILTKKFHMEYTMTYRFINEGLAIYV